MRLANRHVLVALGVVTFAGCRGERGSERPASVLDTANADSASALADAAKESALAATNALPSPSEIGAFHAIGTEPFWGVVISDSGIKFTTPESPDGTRFPPVLPSLEGTTYRWASETPAPDAHRISVTIVEKTCSDGMSDKVWSHAAAVRFDDRDLEGCAERGLGPSGSRRP